MSKANQKSRQQIDAERRKGFVTCMCRECRENVNRCLGCGLKSTRIRTTTHERVCSQCGYVEQLDENDQRINPHPHGGQ